jgi:hypothetical protein
MSEQEKDLEILILRQQLAILQRKQEKPVKTNRAEKMMLAILTAKLIEAHAIYCRKLLILFG